jgi:hypothetical protein
MDFINIIAPAEIISPMPQVDASYEVWVFMACVAAIAALCVAWAIVMRGNRSPAMWLTAMTIAAVFLGAAIAYGSQASHNSKVALAQWDTDVAEWAKSTYAVVSGADNLSETDTCATGEHCYTGVVVVRREIKSVTLVFDGGSPSLINGLGTDLEGVELDRGRW